MQLIPLLHNSCKHNPHQYHRTDIDGLRAIAIVSVVFGHFFRNEFPSGFIGVDIFFVISGFLIANLVYNERQAFDIQIFYLARFRRILPSLISLLILILISCTIFNVDSKSIGLEVISASLFSSNFLYLSQVGYFDRASEYKILLNLWSLGVEAQFYLIYPLLLIFIKKINIFRIFLYLIIMTSFALNIFFIRIGDDSFSFYLLITRLWELILGSLASHFYSSFNASKLLKNFAALFGCALLILALLLINKLTPYPGWHAILPSFGAMLIILSGPHTLPGVILGFRPNIFISKISYPLYLYHWPILSICYTVNSNAVESTLFKIILIAISILLALLTYAYIEQPARKYFTNEYLNVNKKNCLFVCLMCLLFFFLIGLVMYWGLLSKNQPSKHVNYELFDSAYKNYPATFKVLARSGDCQLDKYSADLFSTKCNEITKRPIIALWGDSHAAHLYPGLKNLIGDSATIFQFSRYCPPFFNFTEQSLRHNNLMDDRQIKVCQKTATYIREIFNQSPPDILVLSAFWTNHFDGSDKLFLSNLLSTIKVAESLGVKKIIVVGIMPTWNDNLYRIIEDNFLKNDSPIPERISIGLIVNNEIDKIFKDFFRNSKVIYLSPSDLLCKNEKCATTIGNNPYKDLIVFDNGHLTENGSMYLVNKLIIPHINLTK